MIYDSQNHVELIENSVISLPRCNKQKCLQDVKIYNDNKISKHNIFKLSRNWNVLFSISSFFSLYFWMNEIQCVHNIQELSCICHYFYLFIYLWKKG